MSANTTQTTTHPHIRLLKMPEVTAITGIRRSQIYALVSEGTFPPPVKIGHQAVAWVDAEIQVWVRARIAERDAQIAKVHATMEPA